MQNVELQGEGPFVLPLAQETKAFAAGETIVVELTGFYSGLLQHVQVPLRKTQAVELASALLEACSGLR